MDEDRGNQDLINMISREAVTGAFMAVHHMRYLTKKVKRGEKDPFRYMAYHARFNLLLLLLLEGYHIWIYSV